MILGGRVHKELGRADSKSDRTAPRKLYGFRKPKIACAKTLFRFRKRAFWPFVTRCFFDGRQGGMYWFNLYNNYSASFGLLSLAFFMCVGINLGYGQFIPFLSFLSYLL